MSEVQPGTARWAWLGGAGAILSILACYGTTALIAVLAAMGILFVVNVHVWAAIIVALAVLALLGVALGYWAHRYAGPLIVAFAGTLLIILAIYGWRWFEHATVLTAHAVEFIGFGALLMGAIWDWRLRKSA